MALLVQRKEHCIATMPETLPDLFGGPCPVLKE